MDIKRSVLSLTICFLFVNNSNSQNLKKLDSLANHTIKKYNIKGISMVGVKDGNIIYSKGFGYANETYKMDVNTPIYIASNTKAFIGMAMAKLIESGKLKLDDSLIKYIDRKYFPESIDIEKITIKDIISHNTGLSNDPITFRTSSSGEYPENLQELLIHTVYRNDSNTLKKEFSYSNFGYLLCGIVIENITGKHWKTYLTEKVLKPLQLDNTEPYMPLGKRRDSMAIPYIFNKDEPLKLVKQDNTLHAAGGLFTNLSNMGLWLKYHLNNNKVATAYKTELNNYFEKLIETNTSFGPIKVTGYGFGWYYGDFFGTPIIFHAGGFSGHNSFISYLPEQGLGFFIYINELTNLKLSALQLTFLYYAQFTNNEYFLKSMPVFEERVDKVYNSYKSEILVPIDNSTKNLPLGTFKNDAYGTLIISKQKQYFNISLGKNLNSIAYKSDNQEDFIVQFIPESNVTFSVVGSGKDLKIKYDEYGYFYPIKE